MHCEKILGDSLINDQCIESKVSRVMVFFNAFFCLLSQARFPAQLIHQRILVLTKCTTGFKIGYRDSGSTRSSFKTLSILLLTARGIEC